VYFWHPNGLKPLPEPQRGGDLRELQGMLNLGNERNEKLVIGWLLGCLHPSGPYPLLVLHGPQGSAKSTTARLLRGLIDPHVVEHRSKPDSGRDLAILAQNNWVVSFDNLSPEDVKPWLSNALCRLSTGGGFGSRKLYTDADEAMFSSKRPVMLNGLSAGIVSRPDLQSRSLFVALPPITGNRRTEKAITKQWDERQPYILGALLDAIVVGLRNQHSVHIDGLPRLADFVTWVEARAPALEWEAGEFAGLLTESQVEAGERALDSWPVWPYLAALVQKGPFDGTMQQLLDKLNAPIRTSGIRVPADWPQSAAALRYQLDDYAAPLQRAGVQVDHLGHSRKGNRVRVRQAQAEPVAAA
jgi:putative DNA primase/helicase